MKITDAPALITTPFAQNGTRNDIPANGEGLDPGRASLATGFPDETMKPVTAGGVPPFGADFNGILYALSNAARFYGAGGHYQFNGSFAAAIGGYPMGATVQASDNMGHWLNVVEANSTSPESGLSTGWLPLADHNGTATVTLTGNTTLAPLQAAKANLRFTGAPTGNVTVTFPAWTKRYSIINDCAGDQSIICTTGNGESISIKNGAKYEVGCDGKNLTVATVNASQVFAEPNKNVSALDAPTVQQIINALGAAAAKGFFDTGFADQIPYGDYAAASTGCVAAVRDYAKSINDRIKNSLKPIATSGDLNDSTGVLDMKRGGTGRSDGSISAANVYTAHLESNGDLVLKNGSGDRLSLEHGEVLSIHNADDVEKFRVQDGKITLGGGYIPTMYRYVGATVMQSDSSDKLSVERGAVISAHRADDKEHFRVEDGRITLSGGYRPNIFLTDYGLVIKHVSGDSFSIEKEDSIVKKNANGDITFKVIGDKIVVGKIPLGQVIGAGEAASRSVVDQVDPSKIGWGADRVASAGTASGLYLYAKSIKDSLGPAAVWGVYTNTNPDELDGKDGEVTAASAVRGLRDRLRTGYLVGTYAFARRTSGGAVKYGQTTDGRNLVTSASNGDDGNPTRLGGTWYCLGESPNSGGSTLYVRIS